MVLDPLQERWRVPDFRSNEMVDPTPLHPPKDPAIWQCVCGSQTFYFYNDESTECVMCGERDSPGDWNFAALEARRDPRALDKRGTVERDFGTVDFARRHVLSKVGEGTAMLIVYQEDGHIFSWSVFSDQTEDKELIADRIAEAVQSHLQRKGPA